MSSPDTMVMLKHFQRCGQPKAANARELRISRHLAAHLIEIGQLDRAWSWARRIPACKARRSSTPSRG